MTIADFVERSTSRQVETLSKQSFVTDDAAASYR
jgi:hypothetical protein